jgi:hypothetical protein
VALHRAVLAAMMAFALGQRVEHYKRGFGTVVAPTGDEDDDQRTHILFDDGETHRYDATSLAAGKLAPVTGNDERKAGEQKEGFEVGHRVMHQHRGLGVVVPVAEGEDDQVSHFACRRQTHILFDDGKTHQYDETSLANGRLVPHTVEFEVGQQVTHYKRGLGVVVPPPDGADEQRVHVAFESESNTHGYDKTSLASGKLVPYKRVVKTSRIAMEMERHRALKDAFDELDIDSSGSLDATHLAAKYNMDLNELKNVMKAIDSDGDGGISFMEFEKLMMHVGRNERRASAITRSFQQTISDLAELDMQVAHEKLPLWMQIETKVQRATQTANTDPPL